MADLKAGTTVGGRMVWTQGNFPLFPAGNTLMYRDYTVYTTYDKPKAEDNDFVSKEYGGSYSGPVIFKNSNTPSTMTEINGSAPGLKLVNTDHNYQNVLESDAAKFKIDNKDQIGLNISGNALEVYGNIRISESSTGKYLDSSGAELYGPQNKPTKTDVGLSNVDDEKQVSAVTTTNQIMRSTLASPNFISVNGATQPDQVPRLDQVIEKNTIQDFGYYD